MKKFLLIIAVCAIYFSSIAQKHAFNDTTLIQPIEILAVKASEKIPIAKTNISFTEIEKNNTGRDLPFLLNQTPSVVINSDAGNGIGYTGIRIRGTDASRINVTINNIPYNDAENQGTFFVDLPDIASSATSIQVQRGVGSSTNGAGAFGGSINISTNDINYKRKLELNLGIGSYHTFRNTLTFNSGILKNHFTFDIRLSQINSNGYIDRASSHLQSFYTSAAYLRKKYSLRLNIFSGKEKTYQAWYGIREDILDSNRTFNPAGSEKPGNPYNNETDNYRQSHFQVFQNLELNSLWKVSLAMFLTRGKGYYEQYKSNESVHDYGLPNFNQNGNLYDTTDLIRRLWLDNYFYGTILTLQYKKERSTIISGAGWNQYDGKHFGEIVSTTIPGAAPEGFHWYDLTAYKSDINIYSKWEWRWNKNISTYIDLQERLVNYNINGFKYNPELKISNSYSFFNPKAGITYSKKELNAFISFAKTAKEPNRDDFESGTNEQPKPEILNDAEAGVEWKNNKITLGVNFYFMDYKDQLVLTGKVNDVGAYTRTNIPSSYRVGIEMTASARPKKWLSFYTTATISQNKIRNFTEYLDDYDNGGQIANQYSTTDIAYSPSTIAFSRIEYSPLKNMTLSYIAKYTGRQFLDNTSKQSRSLDPFIVQDIKLDYNWKLNKKLDSRWFLQINNIFSAKYEPNGYSFSYLSGGATITENYYFPMAPLNLMAGVKLIL